MDIDSLTEEERHKMGEFIVRQIAQTTAAHCLLDGALAVRAKEISPEAFTEMMTEALKLSDLAMNCKDIEKLKDEADVIINRMDVICPPKRPQLTKEQRSRMN